jgi:hypothetical protein
MKIAASFLALTAVAPVVVAADRPIACNPGAIRAEERPRYRDLAGKLRAAVSEVKELRDGYALGVGTRALTLTELAEWVGMERRCCPFLTFQIEVAGTADSVRLTLRGPKGAKAILAEAFGK